MQRHFSTGSASIAGTSGLGDVRLGELGVPDHGHHRGLSHFFAEYAAAGLPAAAATAPLRVGDARSPSVIVAILGAGARRHRRLSRPSRSGCSPCSLAVGVTATAMMALHRARRVAVRGGRLHRRQRRLAASLVFYDSLLPHLASPRGARSGVDRRLRRRLRRRRGPARSSTLSGSCRRQPSACPTPPRPRKLSFVSVAVWWLLFSIPLFRRVPEPPRHRRPTHAAAARLLDRRVSWRGGDAARTPPLSATRC